METHFFIAVEYNKQLYFLSFQYSLIPQQLEREIEAAVDEEEESSDEENEMLDEGEEEVAEDDDEALDPYLAPEGFYTGTYISVNTVINHLLELYGYNVYEMQ